MKVMIRPTEKFVELRTAVAARVWEGVRESGTLPWEWIVDDSRRVRSAETWDDPSAIIEAAVSGYRRNNWQEQPTIVEVWSEKSTVEGVLAPVLDELGVSFQVMKAFGSATALNRAAVNSNRIANGTRRPSRSMSATGTQAACT